MEEDRDEDKDKDSVGSGGRTAAPGRDGRGTDGHRPDHGHGEGRERGVVPGVNVTVSSELTGSTREATTGQDGNFVFPLLPVSTYSVTAELQGFSAAKRTGIRSVSTRSCASTWPADRRR